MRKRTDSELLEITTILRNDYQSDAVTAAETELKNRNLTAQQLSDAYSQLEIKRQEQERKNDKLKKIQARTAEITEFFNPLKERSTDRTIKMIAIVLAISYLFFFSRDFKVAAFALQDMRNADFSVYLFLLPLILFPIGIFGFWMMKKFGWIIIAALITCSAVSEITSFAMQIKHALAPPIHFNNTGIISIHPVHNLTLDQLLGKKGFYISVGQIIVLVGFLVFLNRKIITEKFKISKKTQLWVAGLTAIPFIILGLTFLFS